MIDVDTRLLSSMTVAEDEQIRAMFLAGSGVRHVANKFGFREQSIRQRYAVFRIENRLIHVNALWTAEQDAVLRRTDLTVCKMAALVGRPASSVKPRREKLGLCVPRAVAAIAADAPMRAEERSPLPLPAGHAVSWTAIALHGERYA